LATVKAWRQIVAWGNRGWRRLALLLMAGWVANGELAHAGPSTVRWVFFRDKGVGPAALPAALSARLAVLSPRARARRQRVRGDLGVDARDLEVHPLYLEQVRATGVRIRVSSRWLNAVSVEGNAEQLRAVAGLPFVAAVQPAGRRITPAALEPSHRSPAGEAMLWGLPLEDSDGMAGNQLAQIEIPGLHGCGLTGEGVVVGILDTGFTLQHTALAGIEVLAKRDFINGDDNVEDEAVDPPGQHDHGTMILSLLAGKDPGKYSGAAPDVKVILAKVDYLPNDTPIEDDWFVAGLEWAEEQGADLVTTSLGFCTPPCDPSQKDGETEATSKAAAAAVANGLIVFAAAGNYGPKATSISAPADAKGVITVGSVDSDGVIAPDSSRGPTYDDRTKPDVVAPGVDIWVADPASVDSYIQVGGTSVATPLVAGVAAMLLQANPGIDPARMHAMLTSTASRSDSPDNTYGWGIIDGVRAADFSCDCQPGWDGSECTPDEEDGGGGCELARTPGRGGWILLALLSLALAVVAAAGRRSRGSAGEGQCRRGRMSSV
jgi:subtilisin family serine protease